MDKQAKRQQELDRLTRTFCPELSLKPESRHLPSFETHQDTDAIDAETIKVLITQIPKCMHKLKTWKRIHGIRFWFEWYYRGGQPLTMYVSKAHLRQALIQCGYEVRETENCRHPYFQVKGTINRDALYELNSSGDHYCGRID